VDTDHYFLYLSLCEGSGDFGFREEKNLEESGHPHQENLEEVWTLISHISASVGVAAIGD